MKYHLPYCFSALRRLSFIFSTLGYVACIEKTPVSHGSKVQTSERSQAEISTHLNRFWTSVSHLGQTSQDTSQTSTPVDLAEEGKTPVKAQIIVTKTPASISTWSVSLETGEKGSGSYREVTLFLKKFPQFTGPDIHAEWENNGAPGPEISQDIWFESLISDPNFLDSDTFKPIFKTLYYAASANLDKDLQKYVDEIKAMTSRQVPLFRPDRNEKEIHLVRINEFSGRGFDWVAPERDWYRQPWLTYEKTDFTPKCDIMGVEKTRIHLIPMKSNLQVGRGRGAWRLEISSHFYPFYLPLPLGMVGKFYLEDGSCSLFQKNLENKYPRNSPENQKCVDSLLELLVLSSPRGSKIDNRIRVIDYFRGILGR